MLLTTQTCAAFRYLASQCVPKQMRSWVDMTKFDDHGRMHRLIDATCIMLNTTVALKTTVLRLLKYRCVCVQEENINRLSICENRHAYT
jgi:hypothetical protein